MTSEIQNWSFLCENEEDREKLIKKHRNFYKKNPRAFPKTYRGSLYSVSRMLNEDILYENIQSQKIPKIPLYSINNPNKITKLIIENEQEQDFIHEGLIRSYPKKTLMFLYGKTCEDIIPKELCELKLSDIEDIEDETRVIDWFEVGEGEENDEIPTLIELSFVCYKDQNEKELTKKIIDSVYMSGYNYSSSYIDEDIKQTIKGKKIIRVFITFEAKYTEYDFKFNDILYHVTPYSKMEKIRKTGLSPKFQSEEFNYPERVYLFNNVIESQMLHYGIEKTMQKRQNKVAILKIRSDKLKNSNLYKNGKMNFYVDGKYPNVDNSKPQAIFTYNNIPKYLIEDEIDVYEIGSNGVIVSKTTEKI